MAPDCALPSRTQVHGTTKAVAITRDRERHLLCPARRHRLAPAALRYAAAQHCLQVVRVVARQRPVREAEPRPVDD